MARRSMGFSEAKPPQRWAWKSFSKTFTPEFPQPFGGIIQFADSWKRQTITSTVVG